MLAILLVGINSAHRTLLNCMKYNHGPMMIQLYLTALHIPLCYILTITFDMGIYGPPIALLLSDIKSFLI
jgi:Na+-driven multidrug efflux pump